PTRRSSDLERAAAADRESRPQPLAVGALDHQRLLLIERLQLQAGVGPVQARRPPADRLLGLAQHHVVGDLMLLAVPVASAEEVMAPRRRQRDGDAVAVAALDP